MISLKDDELIPVREVPRFLSRPGRKPVHFTTVYRWISRGIGGERLEAVRVGGTMYTTTRALEEWIERISPPPPAADTLNGEASGAASAPTAAGPRPASRKRHREIDAAAKRVCEELGLAEAHMGRSGHDADHDSST